LCRFDNRYAYEALLKNEMEGLVFNCAPSPLSPGGCACMVPSAMGNCKFSGYDVMAYYEHSDVNYGIWLLALFIILFVFKFATYITLKIRGSKA
jgi:hypothetical protein